MASRQLILNKQLKNAFAKPDNQRWTNCRRFLEAGADPNMLVNNRPGIDSYWPILHVAIGDNNYDAVKFLLEQGADKRLLNQDLGFCATEVAAYMGYEPIKLL